MEPKVETQEKKPEQPANEPEVIGTIICDKVMKDGKPGTTINLYGQWKIAEVKNIAALLSNYADNLNVPAAPLRGSAKEPEKIYRKI